MIDGPLPIAVSKAHIEWPRSSRQCAGDVGQSGIGRRLALKYAAMSESENNVETETFRRLERLRELRIEHRDLDDVIHRLQMDLYVNEVQLRRLKKRKLMLKDQIARLESELIPDLNA
jgi:hypothetical protein